MKGDPVHDRNAKHPAESGEMDGQREMDKPVQSITSPHAGTSCDVSSSPDKQNLAHSACVNGYTIWHVGRKVEILCWQLLPTQRVSVQQDQALWECRRHPLSSLYSDLTKGIISSGLCCAWLRGFPAISASASHSEVPFLWH